MCPFLSTRCRGGVSWESVRFCSAWLLQPQFLLIGLGLGSVAWAGSVYKMLYSFSGGEDGGGVFAGVALDANGNLYGTSTGGGAYGEGTVFEVRRGNDGWDESVLRSFCLLGSAAMGTCLK